MTQFEKTQKELRDERAGWLVTGCAGFIGSHLIEQLLLLGQKVVGLDNFSSGHRTNLSSVERAVGPKLWKNFKFLDGDIRDFAVCRKACKGVDFVLHQAALGSVPRSIADPLQTHSSNVNGFLNMLSTAREAGVRRFVYASSSAVYGTEETLPKVEERIGRALSPYAVSKHANELYADVFAVCYNFPTVGLRYFNVFGPRQDPNGPYAAVIPKWIDAMQGGKGICIFGDGRTTRDFCYVANVVQANILSAVSGVTHAVSRVFNVGCGEQTSLNELYHVLREALIAKVPRLKTHKPTYKPFRSGDIRQSLADISKIKRDLGYKPTHFFRDGINETVAAFSSQG
jgi:UDP-N-acetylglucosamine 4-epimerase